MKLFILSIIIFLTQNAFANLENAINDCYRRGQNLLQASRCADLRIARAIERRSPVPDPDLKYSTIFGCTDDFNPQLVKSVYDDRGRRVRNSVINTYSSGQRSSKYQACRDSALNQNYQIAYGIKTECTCSNDFNPILNLTLIDQNYRTVASKPISYFVSGSVSQRKARCEQAMQAFNVCYIQ